VLKNKNYVKLILDIMIALVFMLLFNTRVLGGLPFHEIAGLGIGVGFLAHILLNSQWIKTVTLRIFDRKLPGKTRLGYFLNILLLIVMIIIIVSGLMISKFIFPSFRAVDQRWFKVLHSSVSYFALLLVGIHLGLHWQWISGMLKKVFQVQSKSLPHVLTRVALVLVIFLGGFQILDTQVAPIIAQLGTKTVIDSKQIPSEEFEGKSESRKAMAGEIGDKDIKKGKNGDSSSTGVIFRFSGIIGIVAIITHLIEKILTKKKNRS
jgi:hypothetical protein